MKRKTPVTRKTFSPKWVIAGILLLASITATIAVALSDAGRVRAEKLYSAIEVGANMYSLTGQDREEYYNIIHLGLQESIAVLQDVQSRIGNGSVGTGTTGTGMTGTGTTGTGTVGTRTTGTGTMADTSNLCRIDFEYFKSKGLWTTFGPTNPGAGSNWDSVAWLEANSVIRINGIYYYKNLGKSVSFSWRDTTKNEVLFVSCDMGVLYDITRSNSIQAITYTYE